MKYLIYLMLLLPIGVMAQEQGVHFDHELSWTEIQAKAKAENKYIFVDVFATWCGPCVYMSKNVFTQKEAGDFFNKNFVNIKIQMDETANDDEYVKKWREDAKMIATTYGVQAYPTFLYFSPDGKLVHKVVGGGDVADFIAKSEKALNPETQFFTVLENFDKKAEKTAEDYKEMAVACAGAYEAAKSAEYAAKYLEMQTDLMNKETLEFMSQFMKSSTDKGFDIFLKESKRVDEILDNSGFAMAKVEGIIQSELIIPKIKQDGTEPDWTVVTAEVEAKYPGMGELLVDKTKLLLYNHTKNWTGYLATANNLIKNHGDRVTAANLNLYATNILNNCADAECLKSALAWIKQANQEKESMQSLFTHAGILYRMGEKDAIPTMEKALALSSDEQSKTQINNILTKMKNGEKVWQN